MDTTANGESWDYLQEEREAEGPFTSDVSAKNLLE
jgi:hypothetical protein